MPGVTTPPQQQQTNKIKKGNTRGHHSYGIIKNSSKGTEIDDGGGVKHLNLIIEQVSSRSVGGCGPQQAQILIFTKLFNSIEAFNFYLYFLVKQGGFYEMKHA